MQQDQIYILTEQVRGLYDKDRLTGFEELKDATTGKTVWVSKKSDNPQPFTNSSSQDADE